MKRLYFSGGEISPRNVEPTTKVWPYSAGGTSFTGKPPGVGMVTWWGMVVPLKGGIVGYCDLQKVGIFFLLQ